MFGPRSFVLDVVPVFADVVPVFADVVLEFVDVVPVLVDVVPVLVALPVVGWEAVVVELSVMT
jgi:hypothetical protein